MKTDDFGINTAQAIAGFVGSLIIVSREPGKHLGATISSVVAGTASATYLTPMVGDLLHVTEPKYLLGFAFLLGVLGLKGVEIILKKVGLSTVPVKPTEEKQ